MVPRMAMAWVAPSHQTVQGGPVSYRSSQSLEGGEQKMGKCFEVEDYSDLLYLSEYLPRSVKPIKTLWENG